MTVQRKWITSFFSLILLFLAAFAHAEGEYVTYLHTDIQGSPVVATNEQGQVIWRESYAPWGQREIKDTASANPALGSSVWYTGQTEEQSLGLYYYGARWYSPDIAQFFSIDPAPITLDNPRSFGRYLYANNNPIRFTDPDGRTAVDIIRRRPGAGVLEGGCCAVPRGGAITSIGPRYYGNEGGALIGTRASGSSAANGGAAARGASRSLDDLSSLRGATPQDVEKLIPNNWVSSPLKKGEGIKYLNPDKKGEVIMIEKGWPGHTDPLHQGPYARISRDGQVTRIPLEGNPTLK